MYFDSRKVIINNSSLWGIRNVGDIYFPKYCNVASLLKHTLKLNTDTHTHDSTTRSILFPSPFIPFFLLYKAG